MIRGRFEGLRRRPFVTAHLSIPAQNISGQINFLVDTGADSIVLAPADALFLGIDTTALQQGAPSIGVGGPTATVNTAAILSLNNQVFNILLRILAPRSRHQLHRTKLNAQRRRRYHQHPTPFLVSSKAWVAQHRDLRKASQKAWYQKNRDRVREKHRQYYQAHHEQERAKDRAAYKRKRDAALRALLDGF